MSIGHEGELRLRWMLQFAYMCFLFSAPWSITASQISLEFSILFFLLIVFTTGYSPFAPSLRTFYIAVAVWWVWLVIAALAGPTPGRSLLLSREEWLVMAVPIGVYLMREPRQFALMFTSLAAGMLLVSIQGLAQYFLGVDWLASQVPEPAPIFGYRVSGAFSGYVTFAGFFAIGTTALVGFVVGSGKTLQAAQRRMVWLAVGLGVPLTVVSFGRIAVAALVAGLVVVLLFAGRRSRVWALVTVAVGCLTVVAIPGLRGWFADAVIAEEEGRDSSRRFVWHATAEIIADHPWTGVGQGHFRDEYETIVRPTLPEKKKVSHAHNDILNFAAVLGVPGALLYVILWVVVLRYLVRGVLRARDGPSLAALGGSVCLLVMSMFHGVFVDEEIRALLMFLWAVGLGGWYNRSDRPVTVRGDISS